MVISNICTGKFGYPNIVYSKKVDFYFFLLAVAKFLCVFWNLINQKFIVVNYGFNFFFHKYNFYAKTEFYNLKEFLNLSICWTLFWIIKNTLKMNIKKIGINGLLLKKLLICFFSLYNQSKTKWNILWF